MLVAAELSLDIAVQERGRDGLTLCPKVDDLTSTADSGCHRTATP